MGSLWAATDMCNQVRAVEYCEDCGHTEAKFYHCNNWDCPEDYFYTSLRAAYRVAERLLGVQKAYIKAGHNPGPVWHLTLSPPESELESFTLEEGYKQAKEYSKMIGVKGGAEIFHPFRIIPEIQKKVLAEIKLKGYKFGKWGGVRNDILNLGGWQNYVYFSPHFHILGYYPRIVMKSDVFHKETGWIYKGIRNCNETIASVATYLFTHTAVPEGHKQAVHYFGLASYSKTSVETIKEKVEKLCPIEDCGSENYWLVRCTGFRAMQFIEGKEKPEPGELLEHVWYYRKEKIYTVRKVVSTLDRFVKKFKDKRKKKPGPEFSTHNKLRASHNKIPGVFGPEPEYGDVPGVSIIESGDEMAKWLEEEGY